MKIKYIISKYQYVTIKTNKILMFLMIIGPSWVKRF